jgi:hypothetical protein
MFGRLYAWLRDEHNRAIAAMGGAAIVTLIGGVWAIFTYFDSVSQQAAQVAVEQPKPVLHSPPQPPQAQPPQPPNQDPLATIHRSTPTLTMTANYRICVTNEPKKCPPNSSVVLPCGSSVPDWVNRECQRYTTAQTSTTLPGGVCGTQVIEVTCTATR